MVDATEAIAQTANSWRSNSRNADFDLERISSFFDAQESVSTQIDGQQLVHGFSGDDDFYKVSVLPGGTLEFETFTPSAGPGEFVNVLDPMIRLYDADGNLVASDDNSGSDGRNAKLVFNAPGGSDGTYIIEVLSPLSRAKICEFRYGQCVENGQIHASRVRKGSSREKLLELSRVPL